MKKYFITIWVCVIFCLNSSAQLFGPKHIITEEGVVIRAIDAADIDNDGDIDVFSTNSDKITWFENLDGLGNFGPENIIALDLRQNFDVDIADLDGDGDLDALYPSFDQNRVFWFENLDGQGDFGPLKLICNDCGGPTYATAADLDGDTDMDIIVGTSTSDIISWFENLDGMGTFSPEQFISNDTNGRSINAADINGDNELDIVSSGTANITLAWFENTGGAGSFGPTNIINGPDLATEGIYSVDLDGDGDIDILSATNAENRVAWFENLDGLGNFSEIHVITVQASGARRVHAGDYDLDGDMDVVSAGSDGAGNNKFSYYENLDGMGDFGPEQIIEQLETGSGARDILLLDMDGDGDLDILGAAGIGIIAWYENQTILSVDVVDQKTISIYPNPVKETLTIVNNGAHSIHTLQILDIHGKLLDTQRKEISQINISSYATGVYFLRIYTDTAVIIKKVVKE